MTSDSGIDKETLFKKIMPTSGIRKSTEPENIPPPQEEKNISTENTQSQNISAANINTPEDSHAEINKAMEHTPISEEAVNEKPISEEPANTESFNEPLPASGYEETFENFNEEPELPRQEAPDKIPTKQSMSSQIAEMQAQAIADAEMAMQNEQVNDAAAYTNIEQNDVIVPEPEYEQEPTDDILTDAEPLVDAEFESAFEDVYPVNIIELIIEKHLPTYLKRFNVCSCDVCHDDICAYTLNKIPPQYKVNTLITESDLLKREIVSETVNTLVKAVLMVKKKPSH